MMKTIHVLGAVAAGLIATSAMAADLPRRSAPPSPAIGALPIFTWTGFYAGVNAGYGFGNISGSAGRRFEDPSGFLGGVQLGYNHQVGQIVYGLETDIDYAHLQAKNNALGVAGSRNTLNYLGTVRGRVGYSFDRFMPYVTGGFAYGQSTVKVPAVGKSNPTHTGWVLGGGVEYALTNNITAKVEGLYVDLANQRVLGGAARSGFETGIVRAGINAKF
jgi:outer membrane immunogenic protein